MVARLRDCNPPASSWSRPDQKVIAPFPYALHQTLGNKGSSGNRDRAPWVVSASQDPAGALTVLMSYPPGSLLGLLGPDEGEETRVKQGRGRYRVFPGQSHFLDVSAGQRLVEVPSHGRGHRFEPCSAHPENPYGIRTFTWFRKRENLMGPVQDAHRTRILVADLHRGPRHLSDC